MTPRLTILLPLKGRRLFTLRFLWHANKARLPYRFLIADGQVHPALADLLEGSRELFPELDIEYVRYPDDADFVRFFAKMSSATQRVRTPYVMLADNDDFLAMSAIEGSLDFLESHPEYVCCGGGIAGFSVYSPMHDPLGGLLGPLNKIAYRYAPYDRSRDFNSPSMTERVVAGLRHSWIYYAVFRAEAQATMWREALDMNLSDLQLLDRFCMMRALSLGKARSDPSAIAYLRQYQTSMGGAFTRDWVHHLLRSRFSSDFATIIDRLSRLAAEADGGDQMAIAERLRAGVEPWLRDFLRLNYGLSGTARQYLRERMPGLLIWLKKRRRVSVGFERRALFDTLAKDGASQNYLTAFRREFVLIEEVLAGRECRDFLTSYVSKLQSEVRG